MNPTKPLTIIELRAQNVKRLSAVQIKPSGAVVVIGGQNGAGKSSVLDAIMYGLAGGEKLPKMPVRRGQTKARVVLNLGDLVVTRTFTAAGGTTLAITNKEGAKYGSPQTMLDKLTGRLTFDPLEFSRQRPQAQAETLRALVGLDLSAMKQEEARLFDQRATASRMLKSAEGVLASIPKPAEGQLRIQKSLDDALKELDEANTHNQRNAELRAARLMAERKVLDLCHRIDELTLQIEEMQKRLSGLEADKAVAEQDLKKATDAITTKDFELGPIRDELNRMEAENTRVAAAQRYDDVARQVAQARQDFEQLDEAVEKVRNRQAEAIRAVKFPIEGLALDATGVTLNGIPFEQCSSAEQLRVSVAIGLAMNPKLKVLLIRDGSLLDEKSLALVADMAAQAQAQVWIERVETDGAVTVVIEDGHVKGAEPLEPGPSLSPDHLSEPMDGKPDVQPNYDGGACPDCGRKTAIDGKMRFCTGKCGWWEGEPPAPAGADNCPNCGAPLAIGPAGKMVCTAECKPAPGNFANEDDVPTP